MTALWTDEALRSLFGSSQNVAKSLCRTLTGLSLDTRTLQKGDFFVALKGPLVDGHAYLESAFQAGASGALVSEASEKSLEALSCPSFKQACFVVPDSLVGLQDMAKDRRAHSIARIAAVTGSYGKTSCKEALVHLLSKQGDTHGTKSSFNNHWGVPLSLASLPLGSRFGVFEIGMNHPGEMKPLSKMVAPEVALITTVAGAHLGNMGTLRAIAEEKAAIFEGMSPGGMALLNEESAEIDFLIEKAKSQKLTPLLFGRGSASFARLKEYSFESDQGLILKAEIDGKAYEWTMSVTQNHWTLSALGVLATVSALGGDVAQAAEDFSSYHVPEGRGRQHKLPFREGSITLLDESYNAGPGSMKEAIQALGRLKQEASGRCIAVLADMLELGDHSEKEHRALATLLRQAGLDCLYTVGKDIEVLHQEIEAEKLKGHVSSNDQIQILAHRILADMQPGDIYLVKGSRGQRAYRGRLSVIVDALKEVGTGDQNTSSLAGPNLATKPSSFMPEKEL